VLSISDPRQWWITNQGDCSWINFNPKLKQRNPNSLPGQMTLHAEGKLSLTIKEKATVPLFFGQTLISSLRDMGYNSTTSALSEHVDNAIQWGATEVRVYFHQIGKKGDYATDALVLDNGKGMSPNVLKVATSLPSRCRT